MSISKQRTLDYMELEWGNYVERFKRLPREEQSKRVEEMGFGSFRDMLAHILAWWDEGMGIIHAIAEGRQFERRKYDFDVVNTESVTKYKLWDETEFFAHFEKTRQKIESDLKSMHEAVFENRSVEAWIRAVIVHQAREHLITLSRFIVIDMLENDWATYIEDFNWLPPEKQTEFISKQGFKNFHDLLAHVIGWWEEAARIIMGILDSPAFTWQDPETDSFNVELMEKYSAWSDDDLYRHFETVRLAMIDLVASLPEDAFINKDIEGWLASDVVGHFDGHAIPA